MSVRSSIGLFGYTSAMFIVAIAIVVSAKVFARDALAALAFQIKPQPGTPSRVEVGLQTQARSAEWQLANYTLETRVMAAPELSAGQLAAAIDDAESIEPPRRTVPVRTQRFAGWKKRLHPVARISHNKRRIVVGSKNRFVRVADLGPARLIERSLKSEF